MPTANAVYAVARGRQVGLFDEWQQAVAQTSGFSSARWKKFKTREEAEKWLRLNTVTTRSTSAATAPAARTRPAPTPRTSAFGEPESIPAPLSPSAAATARATRAANRAVQKEAFLAANPHPDSDSDSDPDPDPAPVQRHVEEREDRSRHHHMEERSQRSASGARSSPFRHTFDPSTPCQHTSLYRYRHVAFKPTSICDYVLHYDNFHYAVHHLILHRHSGRFRQFFQASKQRKNGQSAAAGPSANLSQQRRAMRDFFSHNTTAGDNRCRHANIKRCIHLQLKFEGVVVRHNTFATFLCHLYAMDTMKRGRLQLLPAVGCEAPVRECEVLLSIATQFACTRLERLYRRQLVSEQQYAAGGQRAVQEVHDASDSEEEGHESEDEKEDDSGSGNDGEEEREMMGDAAEREGGEERKQDEEIRAMGSDEGRGGSEEFKQVEQHLTGSSVNGGSGSEEMKQGEQHISGISALTAKRERDESDSTDVKQEVSKRFKSESGMSSIDTGSVLSPDASMTDTKVKMEFA